MARLTDLVESCRFRRSCIVEPAHDVHGTHGFIPVDRAHMRLVDRVLALLAADYLTRPGDFRPKRAPISGTRLTKPCGRLGLESGAARG